MADLLSNFLRRHRSNEVHFEAIWSRLQEEKDALANFEDVAAKAEAYQQAKEPSGTAWPEFEKFVTEAERSLMENNPKGER